jgi:hypothetical protein
MYFSYSQLLIFDTSVELPGLNWQNQHTQQGFARQESSVSIYTIREFGSANLTVVCSAFHPGKPYTRIIAVPFHVVSGIVRVEGPEEFEVYRQVGVNIGHYRLVVAQLGLGDELDEGCQEEIDLYFERVAVPMSHSEILLADPELRPTMPLLETANTLHV